MRRTLEALRARDRGRPARSVGSLARPDTDYTTILRTLGARLEAPSRRRPYWSVWARGRFLAAAKAPRRAILRAAHAARRPHPIAPPPPPGL